MTTTPASDASRRFGRGAVRILHTADWQLGMTRYFLDEDAQARFGAARIDVVRRLGAIAAAEGCRAVVVSGDVFESNHVSRRVVVRALDAMSAVPVEVLLLPGNHDPLDPSSVYRSTTFVEHVPGNVTVLDGTPHPLGDGVEVVSAPWRTKRPSSDLCAEAVAGLVADGTIRVLVGHGAVDLLARGGTDPARISSGVLRDALDDGRLHYVALGDRHSTTLVGGDPRIAYAGTPEPTAFDEVDPGNVLVVDVAADGASVRPVAAATWRFVTLEAQLDSPDDVAALVDRLDVLSDRDTTVVRLSLGGTVSLDVGDQLDTALADRRDLFASLEEAPTSSLVRQPQASDVEALGLVGIPFAVATELRELAVSDDPAATEAADALALLQRLVRGGA